MDHLVPPTIAQNRLDFDRAFARDPFCVGRIVGGQATGDGNTLTLNGATYAKGLGVHASSEIVYDLNGVYRGFLYDIGVDDEVTSGASVKFQVYADGVLVYDSGVMTASSATKSVALDVTGVSQLRLVVTDAGDGNTSDHADWANARLTTAAIPPAPTWPWRPA